MKKKCRDCIHMRTIPGNAHIRCAHPSIKTKNEGFAGIMGLLGGGLPVEAPKELNIKANPTGIAGGWFMFPLNFDPTWLLNCDGFTKGQEEGDEKDEKN